MFLILFCVTLSIQVILNFKKQLRYFNTNPTKIYGNPQRLLGKFQLPKIDKKAFIFFGILFITSLLLSAMNVFPRIFIFIALVSYFPYFNSIMSLSFIQRKTNLLPFVLFVLLFAPSISEPLNQPSTLFPMILIKIVIAHMYFSAALQKIRNSGLKWYDGQSLRAYLLEHYLWGDMKAALWLAQRRKLCMVLSLLSLIFELTFWIIIILPPLTYIYVIAGLAFHLGTLITMRINYLKYLTPVYMVFVTDIAFKLKDKLGI